MKDASKIAHSIIHEHKYTYNTEYFIIESTVMLMNILGHWYRNRRHVNE